MHYNFEIEGKIRPKQRPRRGKHGNFYTPRKTKQTETNIFICALQAGMVPFKPKDRIGIEVLFYGKYEKADIDNLLKSLFDGFSEFFDDNKVDFVIAKKIDSIKHKTKVEIWTI